jgi:hypothetical protein
MTVDHLIPESRGGATAFDNLCLACRRCNEFKGSTVSAKDPLSRRWGDWVGGWDSQLSALNSRPRRASDKKTLKEPQPRCYPLAQHASMVGGVPR